MHYIIGLVGPSGSGKTTLILNCIEKLNGKAEILKSTSTRFRRSEEDNLFYHLVSREKFEELVATDSLADNVEYAGNGYGYQKAEIKNSLENRHLLCALVEEAVITLQKQNYPIKTVKIVPEKQNVNRGLIRMEEDLKRSQIKLPFDLEITNSFEPGGLDKATDELVGFINSLS